MPEPSATEPPALEAEPSSADLLAARAQEYAEATRAWVLATRVATEGTCQRLGLGRGAVEAALSGDPAGHMAQLEDQVYDGAEAIAEFAAALKAGGGTTAQFYKLSGAASQLALYALQMGELVNL